MWQKVHFLQFSENLPVIYRIFWPFWIFFLGTTFPSSCSFLCPAAPSGGHVVQVCVDLACPCNGLIYWPELVLRSSNFVNLLFVELSSSLINYSKLPVHEAIGPFKKRLMDGFREHLLGTLVKHCMTTRSEMHGTDHTRTAKSFLKHLPLPVKYMNNQMEKNPDRT